MTRFTLQIGEEEREFVVTRKGETLRIDDGRHPAILHLIHTQNGVTLLEWEQEDGSRRRIRLAGLRERNARRLWVNGRTLTAHRPVPGAAPGSADQGLASTIPAVVSELLVQVGDAVESGQKCILLESMKMVIPIQAPYAGTVSAIHCRSGDSVPAGTPLLDITPD